MKLHMPDWNIQMKKTIAVILFAAISFMPAPKVSAQPQQQVNYLNNPFGGAISCRVNGTAYPVDGLGQIWAIGNGGHWFITGHLVPGPDGPIALRNDGARAPAVCE